MRVLRTELDLVARAARAAVQTGTVLALRAAIAAAT